MSSLRAAGLIAGGALGVHELRYALGDHSPEPVAGHGYLPFAGIASAVLLALACGHLMGMVARARRSGRGERGAIGPWLAWALAAASLLAIFVGQELLEGVFATARAAGVHRH